VGAGGEGEDGEMGRMGTVDNQAKKQNAIAINYYIKIEWKSVLS
jgi:hypothetical protein